MRKSVLAVFVVLLLFSCGKKEVKQVSLDSKISVEAFDLVEKIRDAFIKKNLVVIQQNSTEAGYRDIMANKKPYDSVELTFTPRWVEIEKEQTTLNVTWKSKWTVSGKTVADRGMAVMVLEGRPLKVSKILRSSPFIYPEQ
ncbi:MAG: hypothetical protein M0Z79_01490 [Nitrospiraceae bacterium]|nr:hypothetical protein [Nitrospiraceae bacterium]